MTETTQKATAPNLVNITEKASQEIERLFAAESSQDPEKQGLRLGVKGGGCSGLSYKLAFDAQKDNDYVLQTPNQVPVYIDPKSAIYLKGMTVDYQDGLEGKGFVFVNPNATSTCGCGESFNI